MKKVLFILAFVALIGFGPQAYANSKEVRENASTAEAVCGKGGVKSVNDRGFECKSDK